MTSKVLVFAPTFNEIENIKEWIFTVDSLNLSHDILVVDDSSSDGTTQFLIAKEKTNPRLNVIVRSNKDGIGSAHLMALKVALHKNYDLLITLDADLSHNPSEILHFIEASYIANYIVGTRSRGGHNDLTGSRLILSKGANLVCRILLPTGLSEYTTSYRCYDKHAMKTLISNPPKGTGYAYFIEATELLYRSGLILAEIPIIFKDRSGGVSKIPNLQVFNSAFYIIKLFLGRIYWYLFNRKKF